MIELLVGPIASGKSTYASQFPDKIIVNDDNIVNAVHGGNYKLYDKKLKRLYKTIEHSIISTAIAMGHSVIIDRPNHTRAMRRRYIAIAKSFDLDVKIIDFPKQHPLIHAYRRWKSDNRGYDLGYWAKVAYQHARDSEPPSSDEGFTDYEEVSPWDDSKYIITTDPSSMTISINGIMFSEKELL